MASPVSFNFTDPEPVLHAAVDGTKSILSSAYRKAGPQLRAYVQTSSVAAITNDEPGHYIYTERDWNTVSLPKVARLGKNSPGPDIYRASKTASERALWEFRDEKKPSFTLTTINPA
jgi:nucleoside-diphosphate-sugar epimerase